MPTIKVINQGSDVVVVPETNPIWVQAGQAGPRGPQGPPGTGLKISGTVPSYSDLPTNARVSDVWMTTDTGHSWLWGGLSWSDLGPAIATPGPPGPAGPQGTPGAAGPEGPQGPIALSKFDLSVFPGLPAVGESVSILVFTDFSWAYIGANAYLADAEGVAIGGHYEITAIDDVNQVLDYLRLS